MSKLQSQWDFGDLFAQKTPAAAPQAPPPRRLLTVSELTVSLKRLLEQQFGRVWVTGEVTNLRLQTSGHLYFSIKDGGAQLNCVLFRGEARSFNRDLLRDGTGVNLQGDLTIYEARGQYQLIVTTIELQGLGALQAAFEQLKQRLQAQGLFAQERKRPLPRYPERLGVVTSKSGAALRDVLQTIRRRQPSLEVVLATCRVQGQGAGEEVACAIGLLNEWSDSSDPTRRVDVILVTRGGGSLEDLWAFNEEVVARAIYQSRIPVISGVGHEIDFTISDFVADLRAATPTAAAEMITEGFFASRGFVAQAEVGLRRLAQDRVDELRRQSGQMAQRLQRQHPLRWLQEQGQRLDDLQSALARCLGYGLRRHQAAWLSLIQRFWRVKPSQVLARQQERVQQLRLELGAAADQQMQRVAHRLEAATAKLRLLSPLNVLERGYSITHDATTGRVLQSTDQIEPGQAIRTRLRRGEVDSVVQNKRPV